MNLKQVIGALKTMGRRPSFSSAEQSPSEMPSLRVTEGLSPDQIGRIESRILKSEQVRALAEEGSIETQDKTISITDEDIARFLQEESPWEDPSKALSLEPGLAMGGATQPSSGWKRYAVATLCALLAATSVHAAAGSSSPGSILYPVRLQWEAIEIAIASAGLSEAKQHMEAAQTRLGMLEEPADLDDADVVQLANEMEIATMRAWELISGAQPSRRRTGMAGSLLGLVRAEQRALTSLQGRLGDGWRPRIEAMRGSISALTSQVISLLVPTKMASSASVQLGTASGVIGTASHGRTRPSGKKITASQARGSQDARDGGTNTQGGTGNEEPVEPGEDCSVSQGSVCITVPNVLGSPTLPTP